MTRLRLPAEQRWRENRYPARDLDVPQSTLCRPDSPGRRESSSAASVGRAAAFRKTPQASQISWSWLSQLWTGWRTVLFAGSNPTPAGNCYEKTCDIADPLFLPTSGRFVHQIVHYETVTTGPTRDLFHQVRIPLRGGSCMLPKASEGLKQEELFKGTEIGGVLNTQGGVVTVKPMWLARWQQDNAVCSHMTETGLVDEWEIEHGKTDQKGRERCS